MAKFFISGSCAWIFEMAGGHYLNILKIQKQTTHGQSYLQLHAQFFGRKGVAALWDGFLPWGSVMAFFKGSVFGAAHVGARNMLDKSQLFSRGTNEILSGGIGGMVQGLVISPMMLLMTRVVTDSSYRATEGAWATAKASTKLGKQIAVKEGLRGLMKGSVIFSGKRACDWTSRFFFVELVSKAVYSEGAERTTAKAAFCGLAGGALSALATIPLDVAVAQAQQASQSGKKTSSIALFTKRLQEVGVKETCAFATAGLVPRVAHVAISTLLMKSVTSWVYQKYQGKE